MSDDEDISIFKTFWKTNLPTRNLFLVILIVYIILSIINFIVGPITNLTDFFSIPRWLLEFVGQYNYKVFNGHVYLIITSIFVHNNVLHFLSNCLFLLIYGLRAEERFLSWQYYTIFLTSGILGGVVSMFIFNENAISAGASGGIFGLLGAIIVLAYQEEKKSAFWIYLGIGGIFLGLSAGINVNSIAHGVGLITGIIFPFIFRKRKEIVLENEVEKEEDFFD